MEKIIELKNLTKNFDDQQVLKGINLDIHQNEFLTLLGPSGCGKTTTLRIIAGFEEASSGEVLFDGMDISKIPAYKREINTVFQKYALFPHMNVFDNVAFGLNIKKMDKAVIKTKVERMLAMVGLADYGSKDVTLLSGGQQLNGSALPSASFSQEEIVCSLIGEENNANSTRIPKSAVVTVIEKRVVEIFTAVRARLEQQDLYGYCLNAVLVGGGAQLHGICEKAGSVLELPVRRGKPQHIPLRQTVVPEHMYPMATGCFGLLRYTSRYLLNKAFLQDDVGKPKNKFVRLFQWFLDNC